MKLIFFSIVIFSAHAWGKAVDCSKMKINQIKLGGCGSAKKSKECFVEATINGVKKTLTQDPNAKDLVGFNDDCEGQEGKTERQLTGGCHIRLFFISMKKDYDYAQCVCNKNGCGQILFSNLSAEEAKDIKMSVGSTRDDRESLSKSCKENLHLSNEEVANGKTSFFVSSENCIFRNMSDATMEAGKPDIDYCIDGDASSERRQYMQKMYVPTALRLTDGKSNRAFAIVCKPKPHRPEPQTAQTFQDHMNNIYKARRNTDR